MIRLFFFLLGIFLTSLGLFFLILYLNLLNMGYSFFEFVKFITVRFECYFILIGSLLIFFSLERKLKK